MTAYTKNAEIRWSDLDPNFHLRHSVYYDLGAYSRISFLNEMGITPASMIQFHIGPIIFREECIFKREIKFGHSISINLLLDKLSADKRKWTMKHEIWINNDTLAAELTIDGAWMDTVARKLTVPPELFIKGMESIPKTNTFSVL
ncbi:MAG: acyl-CoA thioesterase [Ferruginibacter sp.]